ncbi:hypothetical protein RLEG12_31970 [Rhizobium leguminosarum bv. trifolii CB782]|uniref:Uncharacterized protein n=1 Tax=Rhizobium hidalgonense TaxID=1538159 RepID=A0A2A6KBT6_9HYPH|nr:hypothetical protein [Rhizobium hidalgonense]AHG47599.1 hypothetical protein RLEG12_31970 [Rhizobium leguminosarum bv. trifolii CB782]EJC74792.1 hypothetical protein Rleg10DRAFT_3288 [Rhizobium leguminosarum bv. trifolii WSM2012]MDR9775776.1 hypothetical protein [Rhizobium hidalgonense]MDR9804296.1 hypothetical protein [Rhizobium hidalgonense]MDR9813691.1 hypothetical protein [Rhizobium hidalgonense]
MATSLVFHQDSDRFAVDTFADVISAETFADVGQSGHRGLLRRVMGVFRIRSANHTSLDIEAAPDCRKRDLGFMDGRGPRREDRFPL